VPGWWSRRVDGAVGWLDHVADEGLLPKARRRMRRTPDRTLLPAEVLVDEVRHHWVAFAWPVLVLLGGAAVGVWSLLQAPIDVLWLPLGVGLLVLGYGSDRFAGIWMERFLITDTRVMRISGVYSRKVAWMPLSRVLDITVERPFWLRPLGCGNLVLENAAQQQGLQSIRRIARPNERALLIHALRTGGREGLPPGAPPAAAQVARRRPPDHPAVPRHRERRQHLA
jgi:hypothetical protein